MMKAIGPLEAITKEVRIGVNVDRTFPMGVTEDTFFKLALSDGFALERSVRVPWLSNQGHLNELLFEADPVAVNAIRRVYSVLGGDERLLCRKRGGSSPRLDFFLIDHQLVVEVDEIQHFTSDRLRAIHTYPEIVQVAFKINAYCEFISRWKTKADRYRATKQAGDFPFFGGRRAQRAYFDSVRDLAAPSFGLRVLRVPAPECDGRLAYERFRRALNA